MAYGESNGQVLDGVTCPTAGRGGVARDWRRLRSLTSEPLLRGIIMKFSGHHPTVERAENFENDYIGVSGW